MATTVIKQPPDDAIASKQDALTFSTNTYTSNGLSFKYVKVGGVVNLTISGTTTSALDSNTLYPSSVATKYKASFSQHVPAYYDGYTLNRLYIYTSGQVKFASGFAKSKVAHASVIYLSDSV